MRVAWWNAVSPTESEQLGGEVFEVIGSWVSDAN